MEGEDAQLPELQPAQLKSISLGFALFFAVYALYGYLTAPTPTSEFYEEQPCPGRKKGAWFSWTRVTASSYWGTNEMVEEGYRMHSKVNKTFLVPSLTKGPVAIIPPSQLKSILSKPESELTAHKPQQEHIHVEYTVKDRNSFPNCNKIDFVRTSVAENFGSLTEEVAEEIKIALQEYWGVSREWTDVAAWKTLRRVVSRAGNRAFLGVDLCRNEKLIDCMLRYDAKLIENGVAINMIPRVLRPVIGPLVVLNGRKEFNYCAELIVRVLEKRLVDIRRKEEDPEFKWQPPCDGIQWVIHESSASGDLSQLDLRRMAHRLIMLNFNSVNPISLALANTILGLFSSPSANDFIETLRQETDDALAQNNGTWTKDAVAQMPCMDSTIRESMRISAFGSFGFLRQVADPDGFMLEDGTLVPKGVRLAVPIQSIHLDDTYYPSASQFKPFRFCEHESNDALLEKNNKSIVDIDDTFLRFGYGKHGCPGRFMAAHQMKLVMALVLEYYDVEVLKEGPKMNHAMEFQFPGEKTTIRVRRRQDML